VPTQPRVTINDVAAAARVSATTVSHVLSGKRPVAEETAKRVRKVIDRLGYTPGYAAQTLQSGSTRVIGLLVPDLTNHFFAALAMGVENAAHGLGYSVVLGNTCFDAERERRYLQMIRQRAIDGLVYAAGTPPAPDELRRFASGFPVALADEEIPGLPAITAVADHRAGGELAGRHLRLLGHRRALVIGGPPELRSSHDRLAGFRAEFDGEIVLHIGDYQEASGYAAVMAQSERDAGDPYTAIFALNDLMALGAMRALRAVRRRVPDDVSIVGFDDIPTAALMNPSLTTVRQPAYLIGSTVAEELVRSLTGEVAHTPTRHVLAVELVERESTSPTGRDRSVTPNR
jgi:LacI family transcriptional regulator, galactose operon repressor